MRPLAALRVAGATARLTRAVTTDDLPGQWWIRDPIDRAMANYHRAHTYAVPLTILGSELADAREGFDEPWWWKYRAGLDCPHCVGFWIGLAVLLGEQATSHAPRPIRWAWTTLTAALTLNVVTAHAGAVAGYYGGGE